MSINLVKYIQGMYLETIRPEILITERDFG